MNRTKTVLFLLIVLISTTVFSQVKKSASLFAGYSEEGFASQVNVQLYPGHVFKSFYEVGIYAAFLNETQNEFDIPLNIYTLNAGYHFRLEPISAKSNKIVTSLGIGGVIGIEELNNNSNTLPNGALIISEDGLIYGGYGAIETDIYLSDNWSFVGRYTHFYHVNSDVGKSKFMVGIGLKYIFI